MENKEVKKDDLEILRDILSNALRFHRAKDEMDSSLNKGEMNVSPITHDLYHGMEIINGYLNTGSHPRVVRLSEAVRQGDCRG